MDNFGGCFENWNAQVGESVPGCDAFHFKYPRYLQHFARRTIPAKHLTFTIVYFTSRAASVEVKFSFKVPSSVEIGSSQKKSIIGELGVVYLLDIWDNSDA